jgi:hypothetical protein
MWRGRGGGASRKSTVRISSFGKIKEKKNDFHAEFKITCQNWNYKTS